METPANSSEDSSKIADFLVDEAAITPDGRVYTVANETGATTPAVTGPCRALEMTYKGWGLGIDKDDNLYVCDQKNNLVFRLTLK